jgi:hypothetical protein
VVSKGYREISALRGIKSLDFYKVKHKTHIRNKQLTAYEMRKMH